jgi:hypothetical protein
MAGFIYIMSNPAFGELIKIGSTNRDPNDYRRQELDTTGVPDEFKVEYYVFASNYRALESQIHKQLYDLRPKKNREFFKCPIPKAIDLIRKIGDNNIEFEKIYYVYPKPKKKKLVKNRPNTRTIQEVREIGRKNIETAIKARKREEKSVKKENNGWKRQLKIFFTL